MVIIKGIIFLLFVPCCVPNSFHDFYVIESVDASKNVNYGIEYHEKWIWKLVSKYVACINLRITSKTFKYFSVEISTSNNCLCLYINFCYKFWVCQDLFLLYIIYYIGYILDVLCLLDMAGAWDRFVSIAQNVVSLFLVLHGLLHLFSHRSMTKILSGENFFEDVEFPGILTD